MGVFMEETEWPVRMGLCKDVPEEDKEGNNENRKEAMVEVQARDDSGLEKSDSIGDNRVDLTLSWKQTHPDLTIGWIWEAREGAGVISDS